MSGLPSIILIFFLCAIYILPSLQALLAFITEHEYLFTAEELVHSIIHKIFLFVTYIMYLDNLLTIIIHT